MTTPWLDDMNVYAGRRTAILLCRQQGVDLQLRAGDLDRDRDPELQVDDRDDPVVRVKDQNVGGAPDVRQTWQRLKPGFDQEPAAADDLARHCERWRQR